MARLAHQKQSICFFIVSSNQFLVTSCHESQRRNFRNFEATDKNWYVEDIKKGRVYEASNVEDLKKFVWCEIVKCEIVKNWLGWGSTNRGSTVNKYYLYIYYIFIIYIYYTRVYVKGKFHNFTFHNFTLP